MDRNDEARDRRTDDVTDETTRAGDVLGLGGAAVPKSPGSPTTSYDDDSVAQRRERARDEEVPTRTDDPDRQRSGATGIDMGSGGQGTHLSGK
jgi:hypothetical protein